MSEIIGIIGNPQESAKLYDQVVRMSRRHEAVKRDQDYPCTIVAGLPVNLKNKAAHMDSQERIVRALGATQILRPGVSPTLIARTLECCIRERSILPKEPARISRGDRAYVSDVRRMSGNIAGLVGGMGPQAGAGAATYLAENETPYILVSNRVPDRTAHILRGGEDFAPYLQHSFSLLSGVLDARTDKAIMVCNAAYTGLPRLDTEIGIIDIRASAINRLGNHKKAIFFAVSGTIDSGAYDSVARGAGIELITPDTKSAVQALIMGAVYGADFVREFFSADVHAAVKDILQNSPGIKGGDSSQEDCIPKQAILQALEIMRCNHDVTGAPVLLSCTELPLVFTQDEMIRYDFIDASTSALSDMSDGLQKPVVSECPDAGQYSSPGITF